MNISILPRDTLTYDLGSLDFLWNNIYANGLILGTKGSGATLKLYYWAQNNWSHGYDVFKRGNVDDIDGAVYSGAELGYHGFYGWDGAQYVRGAFLLARATENWGSGHHGARLEFYTTTSGGGGAYRVVIDHDGTLRPYADNTYDLGSSSLRWKNGYFKGIDINGGEYMLYLEHTGSQNWLHAYQVLAPNMASGQHLVIAEGGVARSKYNTAHISFYFDGIDSPNNRLSLGLFLVDDVLNISGTGNVGIGTTNPTFKLQVAGNVGPDADDSYDLGSSSLRWKNGYFAGFLDIGSLQIGGTEVIDASRILKNIASIAQNLLPDADDSYDLGSSSYRWKNGYFGGLRIDTDAVDSTPAMFYVIGTHDPSGIGGAGIHIVNKNTTADALSMIRFSGYDAGGYQRHSGAIVWGKEGDWSTTGQYPGFISIWTRPAGGEEKERLRVTSDGIIRPGADNTYDLGSSSYKWKNGYFAGTVDAGGFSVSGAALSLKHLADVDSALSPSTGDVLTYDGTKWTAGEGGGGAGHYAPYVGDETELSTTSTSYTVMKEFNFTYLSTANITPSTMIVVVEAYNNTSGETTTVGVYIDGTLKAEISFTETSYTVKSASIDLSALSLSDGAHNVQIQMKVTGGTGYIRLTEVWMR